MARLVVCCDGTWNDPEDRTHIFRIAEAARLQSLKETDIKVYYDKGVGTKIGRMLPGGAFGSGISENIRQAYRWLVRNYQDGDQIFLFGFSRGAFTVRSLAGFIKSTGLVRPRDAQMVESAWEIYRLGYQNAAYATQVELDKLRAKTRSDVHIHFIGVFDTVGALGIPLSLVQRLAVRLGFAQDNRFHDTELSNSVHHARHALAIDEKRLAFMPTLWTEPDDQSAMCRDIRQVWFAGVHADIGGGYEDNSLAEVPLQWMLTEMKDCGLDIRPSFRDDPLHPNRFGTIHDSFTRVYSFLHWLDGIKRSQMFHRMRPIGREQREHTLRHVRSPYSLMGLIQRKIFDRSPDVPKVASESVHESAFSRVSAGLTWRLKMSQMPYRPANLSKSTWEMGPRKFAEFEPTNARHEPRYRCGGEAQLNGHIDARVVDRSTNGVQIQLKGHETRLPNSRLTLSLSKPDRVICDCRVRWQEDDFAGLEVIDGTLLPIPGGASLKAEGRKS